MNDAITVVGKLGADPTLKSVNGDRVAEFRLACTARRKEGEEWVNGHTNWYSVEAWGAFAEHIGTSLRRGDLVMVLGRLKVDQWESGDKRGTSVKIRAEHVGHSLRVGPTERQRRPKGEEGVVDHGAPPQDETPLQAPAPGEADVHEEWGRPAAMVGYGT